MSTTKFRIFLGRILHEMLKMVTYTFPGYAELVLLKCPCYQKKSINLMHFL